MLVKYCMTPNPITINPNTTIAEALGIMRDNNIRRLPVLDRGKLVGIVTDRDLSEVSPSPATSLSVFEINYLLAKTKVGEIMQKKVYTIRSDAFIEEAALLLREHNIGAVPVVDDGKLVGIITETNIFDAFIQIMGFKEAGGRITVEVKDEPGVLAHVAKIISELGGNIANVVVFRQDHHTNLIIRLYKEGIQNINRIVDKLTASNYNVKSVYIK